MGDIHGYYLVDISGSGIPELFAIGIRGNTGRDIYLVGVNGVLLSEPVHFWGDGIRVPNDFNFNGVFVIADPDFAPTFHVFMRGNGIGFNNLGHVSTNFAPVVRTAYEDSTVIMQYHPGEIVSAINNWRFAALGSGPGGTSARYDVRFWNAYSEEAARVGASLWASMDIGFAKLEGLVPISLRSNYTTAITRAEFAMLAVYLYRSATGLEITGRSTFTDTNNVYVEMMAYVGVISGVGGGRFAPNDNITREQAAVLTARLAGVIGQPLPVQAPTFADNASLSTWAVGGVGQMQASGIMGGVGQNLFNPSGSFTREQSIITMYRLFGFAD